jgi:hypothetical protein
MFNDEHQAAVLNCLSLSGKAASCRCCCMLFLLPTQNIFGLVVLHLSTAACTPGLVFHFPTGDDHLHDCCQAPHATAACLQLGVSMHPNLRIMLPRTGHGSISRQHVRNPAKNSLFITRISRFINDTMIDDSPRALKRVAVTREAACKSTLLLQSRFCNQRTPSARTT